MDEIKALSESHSAEAVNASVIAQEAIEKARASQFMSVLEEFFNRGVEDKKFIDVGRIPFICDDIRGIHETQTAQTVNQEKMNGDLALIKYLVFGLVGGIGTIIVGIVITILTKFIS